MKKFKFRLEPLLRYRKHLTEAAQMRLRQLIRRKVLLEKGLELQRRGLRQAYERIHHKSELNAHDLRLYSNYLQSSRAQVNRLEQEIRALEEKIRERRRQVVSRKQEGETLQRLRDRKRSEYEKENGRAEQSAADELHLQTRLRQKS